MKTCLFSKGEASRASSHLQIFHNRNLYFSTPKKETVTCIADSCTLADCPKLDRALPNWPDRLLHVTYRSVTLAHLNSKWETPGSKACKENLDCWTWRGQEVLRDEYKKNQKSGCYRTPSFTSLFQTLTRTSPAPGKQSWTTCEQSRTNYTFTKISYG